MTYFLKINIIFLGTHWQHRRKILTPAFHFNILRRFMNIINEHCRELITELEETDKSTINVVPLISKHTLNTICGKFYLLTNTLTK